MGEGLEIEQIFWSGIPNNDSFKFNKNPDKTEYSFFWFKTEYPRDVEYVHLYLDRVITHPSTETFSLQIDFQTLTENYGSVWSFVNANQTMYLENKETKKVEIEDTNLVFRHWNTRIFCDTFQSYPFSYFPDEYYYSLTNIELEFSTSNSRTRGIVSLIFLTLVVEFPILAFIDLVRGEWKSRRGAEEAERKKREKPPLEMTPEEFREFLYKPREE